MLSTPSGGALLFLKTSPSLFVRYCPIPISTFLSASLPRPLRCLPIRISLTTSVRISTSGAVSTDAACRQEEKSLPLTFIWYNNLGPITTYSYPISVSGPMSFEKTEREAVLRPSNHLAATKQRLRKFLASQEKHCTPNYRNTRCGRVNGNPSGCQR